MKDKGENIMNELDDIETLDFMFDTIFGFKEWVKEHREWIKEELIHILAIVMFNILLLITIAL